MSPATLTSLPEELLVAIVSYIPANEFAQLSYVCKRINNVVTSLIWRNIELHEDGYHESAMELKHPPPAIHPSHRLYLAKSGLVCGQGAEVKAGDLFAMLQDYLTSDSPRLGALTERVSSLCTVVRTYWQFETAQEPKYLPGSMRIWSLFPLFKNLEVLELHGDNTMCLADGDSSVPEITSPPLRKLRRVKLMGYIPRCFVAWILQSGPTLQRLELGLLDRPISTNLISNPEFPPLPEDKLSNQDEDEDGDSDYGSIYGECVIPRPLGGFLPAGSTDLADNSGITKTTGLLMPSLKHLYLCQPSEGDYVNSLLEYSWSTRAEKSCLSDWRQILLSSHKTLEVLVLDQRAGSEYIEADGLSEVDFMSMNKGGIGSNALIEMIESLFADKAAFPALKQIYLYGIMVHKDSDGVSLSTPGGRLMRMLKSRRIACEARLGRLCYFDNDPGYTFWARWSADPDEEEEYYEEEVMEEDVDEVVVEGAGVLLEEVMLVVDQYEQAQQEQQEQEDWEEEEEEEEGEDDATEENSIGGGNRFTKRMRWDTVLASV